MYDFVRNNFYLNKTLLFLKIHKKTSLFLENLQFFVKIVCFFAILKAFFSFCGEIFSYLSFY